MNELDIPVLTTEQMREVDRLMVEEYGIALLQMMENAGRNLAMLAKRMLDDVIEDREVVVLAGRGSNGGGGLAAARHLHNWGAWVQVVTTHSADQFRDVPGQQLRTLDTMGVPCTWAEDGWELPPCDLVIDALIGYGLTGEPQGEVRRLIQLANSSRAPILSLDVPSGLDAASGAKSDATVHASATMTLALPKTGLMTEQGRIACGDLYLADISVPVELYEEMGIEVDSLFATDTIVHLGDSPG